MSPAQENKYLKLVFIKPVTPLKRIKLYILDTFYNTNSFKSNKKIQIQVRFNHLEDTLFQKRLKTFYLAASTLSGQVCESAWTRNKAKQTPYQRERRVSNHWHAEKLPVVLHISTADVLQDQVNPGLPQLSKLGFQQTSTQLRLLNYEVFWI